MPGFWSRWTATRSAQAAVLIVAALISLSAGMGAAYVYSRYFGPKEASYRVCLGTDAKLCPPQTVFVQNLYPDALNNWVDRQCARFKKRQAVETDAPNKDCNCSLVQVTCSATF